MVQRFTGFCLEMYRRTRAFNRVSRLAHRPRERVRLLAIFIWLFLTDRAKIRYGRPVAITIKPGKFLVNDHTEALVLGEIFVDRCYDEALPAAVDLIVDLGCNIGASSVWFAERYPGARVIGVEADPHTAELARRNVLGHPRVQIVNAAAGDHTGTVPLHLSDSWSSSTVGSYSGNTINVPAVPLDEILVDGPRLLLKIDIEGAEHKVLRGAQKLCSIDFITGEFHPVAGESWAGLLKTLDGFEVHHSVPTADGRYTFTARRR